MAVIIPDDWLFPPIGILPLLLFGIPPTGVAPAFGAHADKINASPTTENTSILFIIITSRKLD
ncbi:MAG: hypothetical protein QY329_07520 [Anaerolineales bacterium]|nr:MAG: hypothetical protein QY329_07520 [Anaerolineales bacterium]